MLTLTTSVISKIGNGLIPWQNTKGSKQAQLVLRSIFNYYEEKSFLGRFIRNNCIHLLEEFTGNTSVKLSELKPEVLSRKKSSIKLGDSFIPSVFPNKAGVYCVTNINTGDQYLGSAVNFRARWENHYQNMYSVQASPLHKDMLEKGITNYMWSQVNEYPNYLQEYIKSNGGILVDNKEVQALQILTQYECRLFEQSLITAANPKLNSNHFVNFGFKWNPYVETQDVRGSRPIVATDILTGVTQEFSSIRSAVKSLNIDQRSIKGILNYEGHARGSRTDGKLYSFVDHSLPMRKGSPYYNAHLPMFDEIDYTIIPHGEIWGYDTDLNHVTTFTSYADAAQECDISKTSVKRGINRLFVNTKYLGTNTPLLFLTNREFAGKVPIAVVLTDTKASVSLYFSNILAAQKWLGMSQGGGVRSYYLDTGKLYKKRWVFTSLDKYTDSVPINPPITMKKYLSWLDSQG